MNKIIITGNLTKDPELKEFPSGSKVCEFVVAVNKNNRKKDQDEEKKNPEEADFFHVQVWNKLAEVCKQYLVKGRRVTVEGPVTLHSYPLKDKEGNVMKDADGKVITRSHLLIKSPSTIEFGQKRSKDEVESNENSTSTQKTTAAKPASAVNKANYTAMAASENDELPY